MVGVEPLLLSDAGLLRPHWCVGSRWCCSVSIRRIASRAMGLPRRAECLSGCRGPHLLPKHSPGRCDSGAAVVSAASECGLAVRRSRRYDADERAGVGSVICVVGGSGGVGATDAGAGLAFVAARYAADHADRCRSALRWARPADGCGTNTGLAVARLATARGHLGDLTGQLPSVEDVDLLSMARGESTPGWELQAEQTEGGVAVGDAQP